MKKYLIVACAVLGTLGMSIITMAENENFGIHVQVGQVLNEAYSHQTDMDEDGDEILEHGTSAIIYSSDVEQAKKFYEIAGQSESEAEKNALDYVEKREALYEEAIKNGYSVTDEEVWDYIEELKEIIQRADNKSDADAIMSQFNSEEDYWEYEFYVYKKNLPIQNYVRDLEKNFNANQVDTYSEEDDNVETNTEDAWISYFEQYKKMLVEQQEFKKSNSAMN